MIDFASFCRWRKEEAEESEMFFINAGGGADRRGRDAFVPDSEAAAREAKPRRTSSQEA
jgi:hypothetical protein